MTTKTRKNPRQLFKLKKGDLTKYGYRLKKNRLSRRRALNKAKKEFSYATMIRKLNALSILHKNKNKTLSTKAKSDMNYLRKTRKIRK